MVCPNCGKEIEEGSLFCGHCFADIRIVPTYDSKVEQAVSEVLEDVGKRVERETSREKSRSERSQQLERSKRKMGLVIVGLIAGILITTALVLLYEVMARRSESYYVARAYEQADAGHYDDAAATIDKALKRQKSSSASVSLLLAKLEYEAKSGDVESAMNTLQEILDSAMDSKEVLSAYARIIEIYSTRGEYATISKILRECGDEEVKSSFRQYMVFEPQMNPPSGSYEGDLTVSLRAEGDGSIFYTLDGSRPTTGSSLYTEPFSLPSGLTRVTAVYINRFGVMSRPISRLYYTTGDANAPEKPVVRPEGGTYSEEIRVTVDVPDGTTCYYTTDGTNPTLDSTLYTDPVPVPVGTTDYKFVLIDDTSMMSEITEVIYTRTESEKVSEGDGPAIIIQTLIQMGEPMLADGTVENGLARFAYLPQGRQTIGGKDYYTYIEIMQDTAGNSVQTGRSFAVDITDGTVNYMDANAGVIPIG